ncbi:hypothetical protein GGQ74_000874 [Desulfobaculum xiamenense]|uniref:DUF554 domain-containing protein n=1 Tax=Desulfobaculum xiamenense TaxID=995050 RepID=A0A846QPT9_9BACT|nr:DUF554 domain-containing protein [Desulfobaculum xiamenense]NJB67234.1 hypothetical protein [Desulfobaculum xiamenense]
MIMPTGTIVNVAAVLAGGTAGLLLRSRMPDGIRTIVFQGLGLCTLAIGIGMSMKMQNPLVVIFSVVLGGIIGELAHLETQLERAAAFLKARVRSGNEMFIDGLITAFLLFCVGSMTILGAFDEGLRADPTLLFTKSMLDGFAAIALTATYGIGVLFSVIPLFIFQYSLTLFAGVLSTWLTEAVIAQLTATGGILILGIGLTLLDIKRIRLSNLLPALVIVVALSLLFPG